MAAIAGKSSIENNIAFAIAVPALAYATKSLIAPAMLCCLMIVYPTYQITSGKQSFFCQEAQKQAESHEMAAKRLVVIEALIKKQANGELGD